MRFFPINIDVNGRPILLIGGGKVAERKCWPLLAAGAAVTVIAPQLSRALQQLADSGQVLNLKRCYTRGDLAGFMLVFAATNDEKINRSVAEEASALGILADITGSSEIGSFTTPASIVRGDLLLTISTGGKAPALARAIRAELEVQYDDVYSTVVNLLGLIREKLLTEKGNSAYNGLILNQLAGLNLPYLLGNNSTSDIDRLLAKLCGPGYSLRELGMLEREPE